MADITGTDAGETLDGTEGEDVILGLGGDDALNGFGGKDRLDGGTGIDIMRGGEGNDLFLVDDARDLVIEMIGEGDDTVYTSVSYELPASSLANGASIEAVFAVSAASTAPLDVVGNFWGQSLYGNAGVNRLCGMSGNDYLVGNAGNDVLDGGQGADVLRGGTGNDLYYVDEAGILDPFASEPLALGDRVFEGAGEGDDTVYITGETGIFRQLLPTGSEVEAVLVFDAASTFGIRIYGNEFGQSLYGNAGENELHGGGGADYLVGLGGNDLLDGGEGADNLRGGAGHDSYYVDAFDQVFENGGEGFDTIFARASYVAPADLEIEALVALHPQDSQIAIDLTGNGYTRTLAGNAGANVLTGSSGDNFIDGNGGNDLLIGGAGVDDLDGGEGNDALHGGDGNDYLYGRAGNDVLDGGLGTDEMVGGEGNDVYYVDVVQDRVIEAGGAGGGDDTVYVNGLGLYQALTAGSAVEALIAFDAAATHYLLFYGNELGQSIYGNAGVNWLEGLGGDDYLSGLGGDDVLVGGSGNDNLRGGTGNDTYYVDAAGDAIYEEIGQGDDTVLANASYGLRADAEVEALFAADGAATTALDLTGNHFGQSLYGNDGANVLDGGDGADYLVGNGGADRLIGGGGDDNLRGGSDADIFVFAGTPGNDTILDFVSGTDKIDLSAFDIGSAQVSSAADGANTVLSIDANANGSVDFTITLAGAGVPAAADFQF